MFDLKIKSNIFLKFNNHVLGQRSSWEKANVRHFRYVPQIEFKRNVRIKESLNLLEMENKGYYQIAQSIMQGAHQYSAFDIFRRTAPKYKLT